MLEWSDYYSVGIAVVDEQHRRLMGIINELEAGIRDGKGKETLGDTFTSLLRYTKEHFATEEDLMRRHGFSGAEEHAAEHREMAETLARLQLEYQKNPAGLTVKTISFLCDWLTRHLLGTDKQYMEHLHARGVR